jgi:hypothetical protein
VWLLARGSYDLLALCLWLLVSPVTTWIQCIVSRQQMVSAGRGPATSTLIQMTCVGLGRVPKVCSISQDVVCWSW